MPAPSAAAEAAAPGPQHGPKAAAASNAVRPPASRRAFGDGTVSLLQFAADPTFLVYAAVHVGAAASAVAWQSWRLAALCLALYVLRMLGITAGYHRLLSHRSYKTSRVGQFAMACLGATALQKGPLWWCSHHRHHHRTADTEEDAHSPAQHGFWWSHVGWFLCSNRNVKVLWPAVPDLARFPELLWLEQFHFVPPALLAATLAASGGVPALGYGFFLSTVLCWHATYCINSVAHLVGTRRFRCEFNSHCDARNNTWLALVTLGEGWHNNHHCYMRSARHGFYWHELDCTYTALQLLAYLGLVWDLEHPPLRELESRRYDSDHLACRCHEVEHDLLAIQQE
eukprot:SM000127S26665  [mRNA]  locus=s127:396534:399279:- [translate_table: standard]